MKVLIATDKPFAAEAVTGIREVVEKAGFELVLLEKYTEKKQLLDAVADVDAAIINGNYAIPAGLIASKDGLFVEGSDSPYVNIICVKKGNEDSKKIKALVAALQSKKIADFITERYPNGEVVKVF